MDKATLIEQLKLQIIEYLQLDDFSPEELDPDENFYEGELGLDSIDALELAVLVEREYEIRVTDAKEGRKFLITIGTMADYILANSPKFND